MQLTTEHKQRLWREMEDRTPAARKRLIAEVRQSANKAWELSILEGIHGQLLMKERAADIPLEVSGYKRTPSAKGNRSIIKTIAPAASQLIKPAAFLVGGGLAVYGAGYAVVEFIVPAVIFAAPYIGGGLLILGVLYAIISERKGKKNEKSPGSQHQNVVNIYVNQGDQVRINQ